MKAALGGPATSSDSQEVKQIFSNAGYQEVDSMDLCDLLPFKSFYGPSY
jgi:hypothetical protein